MREFEFRAWFKESISDSEDNDYDFGFYLTDISVMDNGSMIGIWEYDAKEQIEKSFEKLKEKSDKYNDCDIDSFFETFCETGMNAEEWINMSSFKALEQCIGLKDKNEKKIFEGDIVKLNNTVGVIVFCQNYAAFRLKVKDEYIELCDVPSAHEILGNIHNTPELLEEK